MLHRLLCINDEPFCHTGPCNRVDVITWAQIPSCKSYTQYSHSIVRQCLSRANWTEETCWSWVYFFHSVAISGRVMRITRALVLSLEQRSVNWGRSLQRMFLTPLVTMLSWLLPEPTDLRLAQPRSYVTVAGWLAAGISQSRVGGKFAFTAQTETVRAAAKPRRVSWVRLQCSIL